MDFSFVGQYLPYYNAGALVTMAISVFVVFFGSILGVLIALAQRSSFKPLVWLVNTYVWIFRGTPMVVQVSLSYLLISIPAPTVPVLGIQVDLSRLLAGAIVIAMNSGAYVSETVRAGINAVPKGQLEAAYSLGLTPHKAMRYVVLPQALKNILPALGNEFITIVKDSSLLSYIGVMELWKGVNATAAATYNPLAPYLLGALYYLIMTTVLTALISRLEKRLA